MASGYKRKKFFFKNGPQGRYIFSYFIIAGLVITVFTILLLYFSSSTLSITYDDNNLLLGSTPDILLDRLLGIHGFLILFFGICIIFITTRLTHRTIGPLFKIESTIKKMTEGDINQNIILRQKDDCKSLAESLNHLSLSICEKLKNIETIQNNLKQVIDQNTNLEESEQFPSLGELTSLSDKLESELSHFNLSDDMTEKE